MNLDQYKQDQEKYYSERLRDYGVSIQANGWTSDRFAGLLYDRVYELLKKNIEGEKKFSVLDVGCGIGNFYKYLQGKAWFDLVDYHGLELTDGMFEEAQKTIPQKNLIKGEFLEHNFQNQTFDFVISIGALSVNSSLSEIQARDYTQKFLKKMFTLSNNGAMLATTDSFCGKSTISELIDFSFHNLSPMIKLDTAFFSDYFALYVYSKLYALE